jgi:hypothetical protein
MTIKNSSFMSDWKKEEHSYWPDKFKKQIFAMLLIFKRLKNSTNIPRVLQNLIFEKISFHYL